MSSVGPERAIADAMAQARRETEEQLADLRGVAEGIAQEHARFVAENRERHDERAKAAREGEYGEDVAKIQRRIDKGETTWATVYAGEDDSREAAAVRRRIDENADKLALELEDDPHLAEQRARLDRDAAEIREATRWTGP